MDSSSDASSDSFTTLTTVNWITDADLLCLQLESKGIEARIPDQSTVTVQPFFGAALGGVRVQVRASDLEAAREEAEAWHRARARASTLRCEACGSRKLTRRTHSRRFAFLSILFLGFPLICARKQFICADCGHRGEPGDAPDSSEPDAETETS